MVRSSEAFGSPGWKLASAHRILRLVLSRSRSKSQVISASFSQGSAVVVACRLRRMAGVNRAVASHVSALRAFIQHACALRLRCSEGDYFNTSH